MDGQVKAPGHFEWPRKNVFGTFALTIGLFVESQAHMTSCLNLGLLVKKGWQSC